MHFPKGGHLIGGELYYQLEVNNNQGVSEDEALVQESKLTFLTHTKIVSFTNKPQQLF